MNKAILQPQVRDFIFEFKGDIDKLAFSGSPFSEVSIQELLEQIDSRRKIEHKLPTWFSHPNIYYPPKLNLEQTSSERTAQYKSELVSGKNMADITGGYGVDSYYFARRYANVDHFEQSEALSVIASHNFNILDVTNVRCVNADGLAAIQNKSYDLIYVDPSRRTNEKRKVFLLEDCTPDIVANMDLLLSRCNTLMIKTSPMLDISVGIKSLKKVKEVHVVAVNNEVKELLWLLTEEDNDSPRIVAVNLLHDEIETFEFKYGQVPEYVIKEPAEFLYEPNAAILKSGGFRMISHVYGIGKLHRHSHLFTSNQLLDFPGRRFKILQVIPYNKKAMKSGMDFEKANIAVRNFPETVETIRKKWKIKDGGELYVFFTTVADDRKMMLVCKKIGNEKGIDPKRINEV